MNFRKTVEDKILYILFTYNKELLANSNTESAFDIIRKHGLKFEDFGDSMNQMLYKAIQNQLYAGLPGPDFLSIVKYRPKEFKVFEQQADQFLMLITNLISTNFATFSELDKLIYKLKEFNMRDFLRVKAQQIQSSDFETIDVLQFGNQLISEYGDFYNRLMSGVITKNSTTGDLGADLKNRVTQRASGIIPGVPIHPANFQNFFGGWRAPDLIIIAARPGMGKTSFVLGSAIESAKYRHVSLFSLEASPRQMYNKVVSNETGIDYNAIEDGRLNALELQQVLECYERIKQGKFNVVDFTKIEAIKQEARRLHRLGQLDMIIIDYLQLVESDQKHGSREQEVSYISRQLKLLAIELNIPIIALSQVGRACEDRNNKRPMLSDLRESGAIEQDADIVGFLYRDAYYYDKNIDIPYETEFRTEFIVAKARNLSLTTLYFFNDVKNARLMELQATY